MARPLLDNLPEFAVTGLSKLDDPALATAISDRASSGQCLYRGRRWETLSVITKLG
jgi:hypothetical protein